MMLSTIAGDGAEGFADGPCATAKFSYPRTVCVDAAGNLVVADWGNNRVRMISSAGVVSTIAGDGTAGFADGSSATAKFNGPISVCVSTAGNFYVADSANHCVRMISSAGVVSTIAGDGTKGFADGPSATAKFNDPRAVCVDTAGNLVVADRGNNRVRMISSAGVVSTIAGDGTAGFADGPSATAKFN